MKTLMKSILILLSIIMFSCDNDSPVEPTPDYSNSDLETQLAHYKYSDSQYYLQFFPNGTFIQRQFTARYNSSPFVLLYERTGKYKLEGNLIILSEIQVNYNTSLGGVSIIWSDQEVNLVDGIIDFKGVTVLETQGNEEELWNYWETVKWSFHYVDDPIKVYNGRQKYFYEFTNSNPKVRWGFDYLDGSPWSPSEYNSEYTYNSPFLTLSGQNYKVEFKDNKMYWYYKSLLSKRISASNTQLPLFPESIVYSK